MIQLLLACTRDDGVLDACGLGGNPLRLGERDFVPAGAAREDDVVDEVVTLTPAESGRVGSAFHLAHQVSSGDVEVSFELRIGGGDGADGMALVLLDPARASDRYLGMPGGCLGVANSLPSGESKCECRDGLPGWAVTVDTWFNECFDPVDVLGEEISPHGAFLIDGAIETPVGSWAIADLEKDAWTAVNVRVGGGEAQVVIDGAVAWSGPVAVPEIFGLVGFTAATGELYDRHEVRNVEVRPAACRLESE